jgi:hypothetical protein
MIAKHFYEWATTVSKSQRTGAIGAHVAQARQEVSVKTTGTGHFHPCQCLDEETGLEMLSKMTIPSMERNKVELRFVKLQNSQFFFYYYTFSFMV